MVSVSSLDNVQVRSSPQLPSATGWAVAEWLASKARFTITFSPHRPAMPPMIPNTVRRAIFFSPVLAGAFAAFSCSAFCAASSASRALRSCSARWACSFAAWRFRPRHTTGCCATTSGTPPTMSPAYARTAFRAHTRSCREHTRTADSEQFKEGIIWQILNTSE